MNLDNEEHGLNRDAKKLMNLDNEEHGLNRDAKNL